MTTRRNKWIEHADSFQATGPYGRAVVYKNHKEIADADYQLEYWKYKRIQHNYVVYDLANKIVREEKLNTFHSCRIAAGSLILGYDRLAPRSKNKAYIEKHKEPDTFKDITLDQFQTLIAVLERIASALEARTL